MRGQAAVMGAVMSAVAIAGRPTAAVACQCESLTPAEEDARNLANKDIVFDGWVIGKDPLAGTCPMPSAPPVKRGCVRIRVHQRPSCTPMTFPTARLTGGDGDMHAAITASADGVHEVCGLKKGRHTLFATDRQWVTEPDGTPENGIVIDFDPKSGHTLSAVALPYGAWVVVPVTVFKGTVSGQELVTSGAVCPSGVSTLTAYRFAVTRRPDGKLELPSCGVRALDEDEIQTMVRPPPPPSQAPAAPTPPPATTPPRSSSDSGGCRTGQGAHGLAALFVLVAAIDLVRRSKPKAKAPTRAIAVLALLAACGAPQTAPTTPTTTTDVPARTCSRQEVVYFGFKKSTIPEEGDAVLQESVKQIAECAPSRVTLVGHADTLEPEPDVLSKARTDIVARRLEALGVTVEIQARSAGSNELLIPTGPGVKEPQNRRVTIDY